MINVGGRRCYVPGVFPTIIFLMFAFTAINIFIYSANFFTVDVKKSALPDEGLRIRGNNFTMKKEPFRVMSGSLHYFRVQKEEWDDRLLKLKAMGLNTVDM